MEIRICLVIRGLSVYPASWHASCLYMLRCVITYKDKSDMLSILGILIAVVSGWACLLFAKKCISALEKCVFREDS